MDTIELVNLCRQDNIQAFNSLYNKYSEKALRTVYLIVRNKNIAEDIVQEAFYQCYRDIKKLRKPEMFEAWFKKLLIRICWRLATKERNSICESLDENIAKNTAVTDPFESYEMNAAVRNAINKLDIPMRTTVILFYYNDMSIKDIAEALNCWQGTVKSRLHNARKYIEKELVRENLILPSANKEDINKECMING
jgi:RNA polymerase sigma-70 factor (ECF subfamily)